ncbi:Asparagine synthetase [Minicystis rosea]|nr:Asparagine synthetase [Minicystis rosea]
MCGIALLWDEASSEAARARLVVAMGDVIRHRGPDGQGVWSAPTAPVALAHRRLAIQGLGEQGAQPMIHPEGRGVLTYNGELFDTGALREELERSGVVFRGQSDTEILLHALARWGVAETLPRIRGQFAFAWYDVAARRLYLARDRVGIRPLYFAEQRGRLAAASEQKALLALGFVDRAPRSEALLRYLALGRTDDVPGETMITGVRSLPAGHWAEWDGERLTEHRYYRAEVDVPPSSIAALRAELSRAVAMQLVGDVPIGATVSGGLDSSTVALLADRARVAQKAATVLHLFAYHDTLAEHDERVYQRAVLEAMQSPHEVHWVTSSPERLAAELDVYVHHQEEPYGDASSYAEWCIARAAAEHGVKVLLGGLGGDEVFVGYAAFIGPLMLDLVRRGDLRSAFELLRVAPQVSAELRGAHAARAAAYHAFPARLRNAMTAARAARSCGLDTGLVRDAAVDAYRAFHPHDGGAVSPTNAALRGALESWCIPRFLAHSDRMGLAAGVEGRVPLLDERVIAAAWGVPARERVGASGLKASLRAAAAHVLPREVLDRAWKLGFHAPLRHYVAALEEPLRAGHRAVHRQLGDAPAWSSLSFQARWRWGIAGAYLGWVASRPRLDAGQAPTRIDVVREVA